MFEMAAVSHRHAQRAAAAVAQIGKRAGRFGKAALNRHHATGAVQRVVRNVAQRVERREAVEKGKGRCHLDRGTVGVGGLGRVGIVGLVRRWVSLVPLCRFPRSRSSKLAGGVFEISSSFVGLASLSSSSSRDLRKTDDGPTSSGGLSARGTCTRWCDAPSTMDKPPLLRRRSGSSARTTPPPPRQSL